MQPSWSHASSPGGKRYPLDPTYGVPAVTEATALRTRLCLLVAAEPSIRTATTATPHASRPELNASWVAAQGVDAVKFLVQLRADVDTDDRRA